MRPAPGGWWTAEADCDSPCEYGFAIDGGHPLPDPRSEWQPSGVHGPSRAVDHSAFHWTDAAWNAPPLASAVVYELHVGTFTPEGTFDAAIERIPHLASLGVTHVEVMPVAEFPGERGWGYDGVDLWAPHHAYGGPDGLKRFINALHAAGLAAILDVVYNHLGPSGNYLAAFGPYFTSAVCTPWGEAVNFSGRGSDEVREFFLANALMWLRDYHFDGLRLDAIHAIIDASATHILEEMAERVDGLARELRRRLVLIAESDLNDPRVIVPRDRGGYGMDGQWCDDLHHALHSVIARERGGYYSDFGCIRHLAKALERGFVYDGCYSEHRGRRHGRPLGDLPQTRLIVCLQNHDQVGNRAAGERITMLAPLDRVKAGAALYLLAPFVPLVFQGEEWAASSPFQYFTDHTDPDLGRVVSEGRRNEFAAFGWRPEDVPDPQSADTFLRSKLDWSEIAAPPHAEILRWYTQLIALRRTLRGETRVEFNEGDGWLRMYRGDSSVCCNFGEREVALPASGQLLAASRHDVVFEDDRLILPPDSAAVVLTPPSATGSTPERPAAR